MKNTLYYDSKCSICRTEIRLLTKFKDPSLTLIDIYGQQNEQHDFDNATLLSVLHVQDNNGTWHKGLDAAVRAWQHTKFGFIFLPLRWPLIKQISDFAYARWAKNRVCSL